MKTAKAGYGASSRGVSRGATLLLLALISTFHAISAVAQADESVKRIAYFSPQPRKVMMQRGAELMHALIAQTLPAPQPPIKFEVEYFSFVLPLTEKGKDDNDKRRIAAVNGKADADNKSEISRLLAWHPDVIYAPGALPAKYVAGATPSIPIVFGCKCNPLKEGWNLVEDPTRPDRNMTGFTRYHLHYARAEDRQLHVENLFEAKLVLLRNASSKPVRRIGLLTAEGWDESRWRYREKVRAAGMEPVDVYLTEATIANLPKTVVDLHLDGGIMQTENFLDKFASQLIAAARDSPIPIVFPWDEAKQGAWLHLGTKLDTEGTAAEYIVRLATGSKPADLPVTFADEYELGVNYDTAKKHGWVYPADFLMRPHKRFDDH